MARHWGADGNDSAVNSSDGKLLLVELTYRLVVGVAGPHYNAALSNLPASGVFTCRNVKRLTEVVPNANIPNSG
jgi:hypothetical protein